jgi:hypothetical protein
VKQDGSHGTFQTSTVLISEGRRDLVYRSVGEVPEALRTKLLKSTNGAHSGTILIADQRGRQEIARAMRALPGAAQRRLRNSVLGTDEPRGALAWWTPSRKKAVFALIALLILIAIGLVFSKTG